MPFIITREPKSPVAVVDLPELKSLIGGELQPGASVGLRAVSWYELARFVDPAKLPDPAAEVQAQILASYNESQGAK